MPCHPVVAQAVRDYVAARARVQAGLQGNAQAERDQVRRLHRAIHGSLIAAGLTIAVAPR